MDTAVTQGKSYSYSVQAAAGSVESEWSAAVTVVPRDIFAPAIPVRVTAQAGLNSIELAWERAPEADVSGYRVYRSCGTEAEFQVLAASVEAPAYSDRQIASGATCRYRITSLDQAGNESTPSDAVTASAP